MEGRDGYGKMRTSRKLSATSSRGKANQWKFTWKTCGSIPLPHGRGSVSHLAHLKVAHDNDDAKRLARYSCCITYVSAHDYGKLPTPIVVDARYAIESHRA